MQITIRNSGCLVKLPDGRIRNSLHIMKYDLPNGLARYMISVLPDLPSWDDLIEGAYYYKKTHEYYFLEDVTLLGATLEETFLGNYQTLSDIDFSPRVDWRIGLSDETRHPSAVLWTNDIPRSYELVVLLAKIKYKHCPQYSIWKCIEHSDPIYHISLAELFETDE